MELSVQHIFTGSVTKNGIQVTIQAESFNKTVPTSVKVQASGNIGEQQLSAGMVGNPVNFTGTFNFSTMSFSNSTLHHGPAEAVAVIEELAKMAYEDLKAEIVKFYPE